MTVTIVFWVSLLLPGYVIARVLAPEDLKCGLPGAVSLSFLAAWAVLSPISILCYLLRCPVAVLSAGCVLAVVAGAVEITRRGWWRELAMLAAGGVGIELLILGADMAMGGRVGAFLGGGDERLHLGRMRFLLDHGFSNLSPYVPADGFLNIYHTNLLHGLYATCSQLTGVDVEGVWYASLAVAKLLIAGAYYFLAWSVFERRWVAWCVALFAVVYYAPVTYVTYPNKLAPLWLFPMVAGFAVQASRQRCGAGIPIKLGAGMLLLGQVHSMYAVFTGIAVGPALMWTFLRRLRPGGKDRWQGAACVAALFVGAPFAILAKHSTSTEHAEQSTIIEQSAMNEQSGRFHHFDNGWVMLKPTVFDSPRGITVFSIAAVGVACSLFGKRRGESGFLIGVAGSVACVLFIPPLCTAAVKVFGGEWITARMQILLTTSLICVALGGLTSTVEPFATRLRLRSAISIGVVCFGGLFAAPGGLDKRLDYFKMAKAPVETRQRMLHTLREFRAFLREHIPSGDTVLADPQTSMWLVMLHDCYVVATAPASTLPDLEQRKADVQTIVSPRTRWNVRRDLLRKYGVTRCILDTRVMPVEALGWTRGHLVGQPIRHREYLLVLLDTE